MRFDNKDLGLFSNEAPKKKKRRIPENQVFGL